MMYRDLFLGYYWLSVWIGSEPSHQPRSLLQGGHVLGPGSQFSFNELGILTSKFSFMDTCSRCHLCPKNFRPPGSTSGKIIRGVLCVLKSPISALKICFRSKDTMIYPCTATADPLFSHSLGPRDCQATIRSVLRPQTKRLVLLMRPHMYPFPPSGIPYLREEHRKQS